MSKVDAILSKGAEIFNTQDINKKLYSKVYTILSNNTEKGTIYINNEVLADLEYELFKSVKTTDFNTQAKNFIALLDALENAVFIEQSAINKIKLQSIKSLWSDSTLRSRITDKVLYDLGSNGVKDVFVKTIANAIREVNVFDMPLTDAQAYFKEKIVNNDYTNRYLKNTVSDTLNQYDGAMQNEIKKAYGFDKMIYSTNTIETSRPICIHLHDTLKGRITSEQLKVTLSEYCPKGKPSDTYIEIETPVEGKIKRVKKGAGMIDGTTIDNFSQLRGGYGCRHRAIWVKNFY